jgi:hypothetical protein
MRYIFVWGRSMIGLFFGWCFFLLIQSAMLAALHHIDNAKDAESKQLTKAMEKFLN